MSNLIFDIPKPVWAVGFALEQTLRDATLAVFSFLILKQLQHKRVIIEQIFSICKKCFFVTIIILCVNNFLFFDVVFAQLREPKIAYVYPAGGQRGTSFEVLVSGRLIAKPTEVLISGNGIKARIIKSVDRIVINDQAARIVAREIYDTAKKQLEPEQTEKKNEIKKENKKIDENKNEELVLPSREEVLQKYLYFDRLLQPSNDDVQFVFYEYFSPRPNKNPVEGMTQGVIVEVTIDADVEVGERELRLLTSAGLTKPVKFIVSDVCEVREFEPNDFVAAPKKQFEAMGQIRADILPKNLRCLEPQELPVVFNGQIRNGDVDSFSFRAVAGQKLVISAQARQLIPYLADAVPGWFQAAITLFDPTGKKIVSASSYRFNPDPVIFFDVPQNGIYSVEIRDSIFRGRDDFVYRLSVGETAVVTSIFPLGCNINSKTPTIAQIDGWNLPFKTTHLDIDQNKKGIQTKSVLGQKQLLYPINYVVDDLPELVELELNDGIESAQEIELPVAINGRIDSRSDVDYFSFNGKSGEIVIFDVMALSLNSPLDLCLEVLDASGNCIASNDDRAGSDGLNIGLATHHADPYLIFNIQQDGVYFVRLFNIRQEGGKEFAYRINVTNKRDQVVVYTNSSTLNLHAATQPIKFFADRRGGFDGEIKIRPTGDRSNEFILDGAKFQHNSNEVIGTLSILSRSDVDKFVPVFFEAVIATLGGEKIFPVIVADDFEQAFIYHHLVPAERLMVVPPRNWQMRQSSGFIFKEVVGVERDNFFFVTIISGEQSELRLPFGGNNANKKNATENKTQKKPKTNITPQVDLSKVSFELVNAPEGITLANAVVDKKELRLTFAATKSIPINTQGNIIVKINLKPDKNKPTIQSLGTLPTINFKIEPAKNEQHQQ
ncbi:MAG: PPC domain-containing protein [Planctomycetaceae bacterium]|nr:PPC domain-containing protein [Planctomycetaceae bacterium]